MNGIEKHASFYRAYLADDRSLASVAGFLVIAIALWLLLYLLSIVGPYEERQVGRPAAPAANAAAEAARP